jgi:hypothetical protein
MYKFTNIGAKHAICITLKNSVIAAKKSADAIASKNKKHVASHTPARNEKTR